MPATLSPLSEVTEPFGFVIDDKGKVHKKTKTRLLPKKFGALSAAIANASDIRSFCEKYLEAFPVPVHIARGEKIHEVFEKHRPDSCMRYDYCREMRQVYADNPEKVSVFYWLKGEHEFSESDGSLLVWDVGDQLLLDRVYASGYYPDSRVFLTSIVRQIRLLTGASMLDSIYEGLPITTMSGSTFNIELKHPSNRPLAYMDSFSFVESYGDDFVVLSNKMPDQCTAELDNTTGTLPNGDIGVIPKCCGCNRSVDLDTCKYTRGESPICDDCIAVCECCNDNLLADDINTVDPLGVIGEVRICWRCQNSHYRYLSYEGRYAPEEMTVEGLGGRRLLRETSVRDYNGCWQRKIDCKKLSDGSYCLARHCMTLSDGRVVHYDQTCFVEGVTYHKDDCVKVQGRFIPKSEACQTYDGQYEHREDCVELYDGSYALRERATKTHTGEYAVIGTPYPNFVITDPAPEEPEQVSEFVPWGHDAILLKGLPFCLLADLHETVGVYTADLGWWFGSLRECSRDRAIEVVKEFWASLSDEIRDDILSGNLSYPRMDYLAIRFQGLYKGPELSLPWSASQMRL